MGLLDYIPIVATVKHAVTSPCGREVKEYQHCKLTPEDCALEGPLVTARKKECRDCVLKKQNDCAIEYAGGNLAQAFLNQLVNVALGAVLTMIVRHLVKQAGGKIVGGAVAGIAGIVVLGLDAALDIAIVISKLTDINRAAQEAIAQYCDCPQS